MQSDESTSGDTSSDGPQNSNVTAMSRVFASTLPLLISSLPGLVQDMPPRCLHMSTLLHCLPADNSAGVNLDEPMCRLDSYATLVGFNFRPK